MSPRRCQTPPAEPPAPRSHPVLEIAIDQLLEPFDVWSEIRAKAGGEFEVEVGHSEICRQGNSTSAAKSATWNQVAESPTGGIHSERGAVEGPGARFSARIQPA